MFILIHVHGYIIGYYASYKEAIEALDMSDIDTEMYEVKSITDKFDPPSQSESKI